MTRHYTAQDSQGQRYSAITLDNGHTAIWDHEEGEEITQLPTFADAKAAIARLAD